MSFNPGVGGGSSIAGSTDVALSNPTNAQVLGYNSTLSKWQNQTASSATITASSQTANYTLALIDAGTVVEMNSSSLMTLTVPPNSSVAFPVGTTIEITQIGSGAISIAGGSGVTVHSPATLQTRGQWSSLGLRKRATDVWLLSGDLA